MDASLAYLQLKPGINICPFDLDYDQWHTFVPLSWTKMLRGILNLSGFSLHLAYENIRMLRMGDNIVAEMFLTAPLKKSLNHCKG